MLFSAKSIARIGTWNVRTLWADGSLELLIKGLERFKWEVIGLSEVRRKGHGTVEHEGCKLMYSGSDKRLGGVGILLSKNAAKSLIEFHPISSRVMAAMAAMDMAAISASFKHMLQHVQAVKTR